PPRRKLPVEAVRTLERWVEMGAPDPRIEIESPEGDPRSVAAAEALPSADHWVWKTPAWPELPAVGDASWPRTEIDRFILAKLESAGLSPSPEVDRRVWLRRVTFALAGLPPTPDELAAFLEDD